MISILICLAKQMREIQTLYASKGSFFCLTKYENRLYVWKNRQGITYNLWWLNQLNNPQTVFLVQPTFNLCLKPIIGQTIWHIVQLQELGKVPTSQQIPPKIGQWNHKSHLHGVQRISSLNNAIHIDLHPIEMSFCPPNIIHYGSMNVQFAAQTKRFQKLEHIPIDTRNKEVDSS